MNVPFTLAGGDVGILKEEAAGFESKGHGPVGVRASIYNAMPRRRGSTGRVYERFPAETLKEFEREKRKMRCVWGADFNDIDV